MAKSIIRLTMIAALASVVAQASAEELTAQQRDLVEAALAPSLVMPETALWRFAPLKPYLGTINLVCGDVNYQSSVRQYQGYHRFYAILDGTHVTLAQIEDARQDTSGRLHEKVDLLCGKASPSAT